MRGRGDIQITAVNKKGEEGEELIIGFDHNDPADEILKKINNIIQKANKPVTLPTE